MIPGATRGGSCHVVPFRCTHLLVERHMTVSKSLTASPTPSCPAAAGCATKSACSKRTLKGQGGLPSAALSASSLSSTLCGSPPRQRANEIGKGSAESFLAPLVETKIK